MRAGWQTKPLSEVCAFKPPKSEARAKLTSVDEVSFVPMEHLGIGNKELKLSGTRLLSEVAGSYTYFAEGDVLLAKITPCFENGKLGIARNLVNGVGFGSSEYIVIRPSTEVDADFLYHFLDRATFREEGAKQMTGAVGHKRVPKEYVEGALIPVPSIEEQHRIVTLLDEAFADIATAKANAEKNLQNAREFFLNHLSEALQATGPDWVEATVGETCTLKSGTTVPTSIERPDGEIPYVKVAEMSMPENAEGICTSIRFLDRNEVKRGWLIPTGAVIFPKRGGAILTNKKRLALVEMCADLNIMSVIPSDVLTPEFLYLYFLNVDMRKLGTGSSIPQINNYDIAPLKISFPKSKDKQVELTQKIRAIEAECQSLSVIYRQKLTALDDLKKSLLHQAFSGQLTQ